VSNTDACVHDTPHQVEALALMAFWASLCVLVRRSPDVAYGAFVAQFTPYIMLFTPVVGTVGEVSMEPDNIAFRRIESNLIGAVVFCLIEVPPHTT